MPMAGGIPDGPLSSRAAVAQAFPEVPHHLGHFPPCTKRPSPSMRPPVTPRRSSKTMSVGCAPWNGPWRDAPLPRLRSSGAPVGPSGGPAPRRADRLWRLPVSRATIASLPWPSAWSGWKKGAVPKARGRLRTLLRRGLDATAALGPGVRVAYGWGHRAAPILHHHPQETGAAVQRRRHGWLGAMGQQQAHAGPLAPAVEHFLQVSRRSGPGLLHGYHVPDLPRTTNELEQFFGAYRSHARRTTGRTVASPAVGLRGAGRLVACAAPRLRPFTSEALAPDTVRAWPERRQALETRRQQRTQRRRFRRAPATSRGKLEAQLLQ